jgi:hypothetical protein
MVYSDKNCQKCGTAFSPTSSVVRFCCWQCRFKSLAPTEMIDEACWEWPLSTNKQTGYGQFMVSARPMRLETAHRLSFELFKSPLLPGEVVRHDCDNRSCFNPAHLQKGTHAENHEDMVSRARHHHGETHRGAKLKEVDVLEIRLLGGSTSALARKYGVTRRTIYQVLHRESWKHI